MVYLLDKKGKPLMPTKRHGHVRHLLDMGKAKVVRTHPFTIQLTYDTPGKTQPVILGMDPGRTNIGLCAVSQSGEVLFAAEVKTRNREIPKLMADRSEYRKSHRNHGRREVRQRRAASNGQDIGSIERHFPGFGDGETQVNKHCKGKTPRVANRKRSKGWLTPTANQLLETHLNAAANVAKRLPITQVAVELNKFAFLKLDDPSVVGIDFQNGPLKGCDGDVKKAVYALQEGRCLLCGAPITQYHHVVERHKNGSETIRNRVGLCDVCHRAVHTDSSIQRKLLEKQKGLEKKYGALGILNQIFPKLLEDLREKYQVSVTTGWETKKTREDVGLLKTHVVDAYVIAQSCVGFLLKDGPKDVYTVKQFRRHDRQACKREMVNRYYLLDGKVAAVNRYKAIGQTGQSLKEYRASGKAVDGLTIKHRPKVYKDMDRYYPGCQVFGKGDVKTVLKRASGYYWFEDGSRIGSKKFIPSRRNTGLVFVANS